MGNWKLMWKHSSYIQLIVQIFLLSLKFGNLAEFRRIRNFK